MRILRLELFGFKSFKDKTIITFDQPITAIVGSNGCGKSNVVDALYWVMGDMSPKHLRGSHMSDVIFSGSRDAAALDMAEVTMVLARDPATDPELPPQFQASNEIQITRRYYRSGDSECFINKVHCRLRDIQEFFMDTGLGAKAYSIIEQGAIMRMVTQKPEERRTVIEEVAGIMKFKARKAETERKLEHAGTNLARIDDIVKDLQKQLTTLKRQAEKAEKYKIYSDELKDLEIRLASREWVNRRENQAQAAMAVTELSGKKDHVQEQLEKERVQVEVLREELQKLEADLTEQRSSNRNIELTLKDTEARISTLQARRESLGKRLDQDKVHFEEILVREGALLEELLVQEEDLTQKKVSSEEWHRKIDESRSEVDLLRAQTDTLRKEVDQAKKTFHSHEIEETKLTQRIQEHQRAIQQLQNKQESLRLQLVNIESETETRSSERQGTLDFLELAFSKRSDLEGEKLAVDKELFDLEEKKQEYQNNRDEIRRELTGVQVRREQLEALEKNMEGVNATSRWMAMHLRDQGVEQTLLADVVKCPPILEKALEAVIGPQFQRVLTQGLSDIEALQKAMAESGDAAAKEGRSTLWLSNAPHASAAYDLNSLYMPQVSRPQLDESITFNAGSESPGPDGMVAQSTEAFSPQSYLHTDHALRTVKEYLLGHQDVIGPMAQLIENEAGPAPWQQLVREVWVVKSRDLFPELLENLGSLPLTFVSLDGDILSPEGMVDLKPLEASKGVGLVQRKREINELALRQNDLEIKLTMAQELLEQVLRSVGLAKEKFQDLTVRLAALNPDVERHSLLLRQVEAQVARLSEKKNILSEDLAKAMEEEARVTTELEAIANKISESSLIRKDLEIRVEQVQAQLEAEVTKLQAQEETLRENQSFAKDADRAVADLKAKLAALEQEQMSSMARKSQLSDEIMRIESELAQIQEEFDGASQERGQQQVELESSSQELQLFQVHVEKQKREASDRQKELDRLNIEFQTLSTALKDVEQSLAVNDVEIKNLSERLESTYQIKLENLDEESLKNLLTPSDIEELADPEAAKKHAQTLRNRIDNLGKINMVAIEEFTELSKRHEYLFIQRQDVNDAISQLRDAIDKIDRESRTRFAEAYQAVNEAFQKTFPVLFGGGNAELRLTNPDNLLETGVEIVAQPPGKKLQSVTLLSGGEKALTAVSLIFGIFSIKPSPFCVLDEVDAPLDDSNVNRFNTQVRRMAETSQIILITHHKKTMESTDALFGVTMEQPGISKVTSAKLGELKTTN